MKVAVVSQIPFSLDAGGLELQVLAIVEALRGLGVHVELLDPWKRSFDANLLHCFGSEYQLGEIVLRAKARGIPVVVSAVFAPHQPRVLYAAWRLANRFVPMKTSFGIRAEILRAADAVVALVRREAADLVDLFGTDRRKIHIIPNGVEARFFGAAADAFAAEYGIRDFALSVAHIEPLKNQLRLVQAAGEAGVPLVLIGAARSRERRYAEQLSQVLARHRDVLWIRGLPHESPVLPSAYAAARVHVLPSMVEVQPLSVLEAAAAGANIVVSDLPPIRETFANYAWYCRPRSVRSIRRALLEAYRAPRGARYTARPDWLLSWADVARRLLAVYRQVLGMGEA